MKKKNETFYLTMEDHYFKKGDIINLGINNNQAIVIKTPHKKWLNKLLIFITFGFYEVSINYKCKLISNDR